MTKDEIKAMLDEAGVEYSASATKDELEALLPASEDEVDEPEAEEVEEAVEDEVAGDHVTVTWPGNYKRPSGDRVYSKEVHGADFKKLAKEFAEKVGGTVS